MNIPTRIVLFCEDQGQWDDDIRQELYVKMLEMDDFDITKRWCITTYNNIRMNTSRNEANRARLREDNYDEIVKNLGLDGVEAGPEGTTDAESSILIHFNSLSALLRETLIEHYIEGRAPEEMALAHGENVEAVRKRITRARNLLIGDK